MMLLLRSMRFSQDRASGLSQRLSRLSDSTVSCFSSLNLIAKTDAIAIPIV